MKSLELKFRLREQDQDRTSDIEKIRNFAEDLSLRLHDLGDLPMDEADRATDTVVVREIHTRQSRPRRGVSRKAFPEGELRYRRAPRIRTTPLTMP
jgi:hypothetical protein